MAKLSFGVERYCEIYICCVVDTLHGEFLQLTANNVIVYFFHYGAEGCRDTGIFLWGLGVQRASLF